MSRRIKKKIEDLITEEDQFGFRKNVGTREAIPTLKIIIKKKEKINRH